MNNYGLTQYQINKANKKLKFNKEFMQSNGIQLDNKMIPFADFVCNSYMNADRYIAELQHRAWSVYDYANDKGLENVFITLTLPSKWHPMKQKSQKNKTMVFNKKFGGRTYIKITTKQAKLKFDLINARVIQNIPFIEPTLDFTETIDKYTPRNASKELSKMLKKFFDDRAYKNVAKDDRCYFRVTEPHKDGTPHVHMSLFVPQNNIKPILASLNRLFTFPQVDVSSTYIPSEYTLFDKVYKTKGEWKQGYKLDINDKQYVKLKIDSSISYLMKYVLKTLDDLREDSNKVTNLTLWYLYHGISRFYTSRTFVSLDVYRKLNGMYTLADLTKEYRNDSLSIYTDTTTKKVVFIENEFGCIYTPKPVNWYDKLIDVDHTYLEAEYEPLSTPEEVKKPLQMIINDEEFIIHNHALVNLHKQNKKRSKNDEALISIDSIMVKPNKKPHQMKNYQLRQYFESITIDSVNPAHYVVTHNLMIDRGLIKSEYMIPSESYEAVEVF